MPTIKIGLTPRSSKKLTQFIAVTGKLGPKLRRVSNKVMVSAGQAMYTEIRKKIAKLGHYTAPGHNTPQPLINKLHRKKLNSKDRPTEKVYMETRGKGVNPIWVELGTNVRGKKHATPRYYFKEGINAYKNSGHLPKKLKEIRDLVFNDYKTG